MDSDQPLSAREKWGEPAARLRPGVRAAARNVRRVAPVKGLMRVREGWIFALQCAIGAGLALWVAENVFQHHQPFFAPIAAVLSLGVSSGKKLRRGFELVLGASVGVGIGDLVISNIGSGYWQVSVVVFVAIVVATFVDKSPTVAFQASSTAVLIATLLPPGSSASFDRVIDALVGGVIGIVVMAVVPSSPLKPARREVSTLISKAALVLDDVATGMDDRNREKIEKGLRTARGTQTTVNALLQNVDGGSEAVVVSPVYWTARRYTKSMTRILVPVDNVMRNVRVLARRAETMIADGVTPPEEMIELVRGISDELGHLGALFAEGGTRGTREEAVEIPEIIRNLQRLAAGATLDIADNTGLSGTVVLAQCRSIIVDALQVCGFSRESALATLVPTVDKPWLPPEVRE